METLRDIHGLDAIPGWPLALGWWLLLVGCGLLILGLLLLWWRLPYWRLEAYWRLWWLARRWQRLPPKQLASELSELLRRIALVRFGRRACAGLSGDAWLVWLHAHDPRGFDWSKQGGLLLALPYAPTDIAVTSRTSRQLRLLLAATRAWVVPTLRRKGRGHA